MMYPVLTVSFDKDENGSRKNIIPVEYPTVMSGCAKKRDNTCR